MFHAVIFCWAFVNCVKKTQFNAPIARSDGTFELLKQANLAYKDRDWENAAQNYRDLLKQESRNPDVRFRLGRCQYELAQYIQAKIQF